MTTSESLRRATSLVLSLAIGLSATAARADDKTACIAAANEGQDLRLDGKLRAARERLMACAAATCPDLVRADCTKWLEEVDARIPSIVVMGKRKDGTDVVDASVTIDGVKMTDKLDAKAMQLDPGTHTIEVALDASHVAKQTIVLAEGEQGRLVTFRFEEAAVAEGPTTTSTTTTEATPTRAAPSPWAWVAAGVGVVAIGSFTYFGLKGRHELAVIDESGCAPYCDPGPVDDAKRKLLVADVSLGVGLVSLGIATWLFLDRPTTAASTEPSSAVRVDVSPRVGGGVASLSGAF